MLLDKLFFFSFLLKCIEINKSSQLFPKLCFIIMSF